MAKGGPPLFRLSDEEVSYLKSHLRHDIMNDKLLYNTFYNNTPLREWLINRILMTADHFKVRYARDMQRQE